MADQLAECIPVYLSQEFSNTIHLVKSPLRDPTRPYDDIGHLKSATFKPNSNIFSFDYSLNQRDAHYNHSSENQIDTFTLQTSVTPKRANYVIGQRTNDAFILHPVTAIHSLLPVFTHVDSMQQEYDNDLLPQNEDEDTALKQVQLKVKKAEKVGGVKRVTHDTLSQAIRDDKAQHCTSINVNSDDVLNGNVEIPPLLQEGLHKLQQKRINLNQGMKMGENNAIPISKTMSSVLDDMNININDVNDDNQKIILQSVQKLDKIDFDQRQNSLLSSQPLYNGSTEPRFTSQPPQLAKNNAKNGNNNNNQEPTPLAYFVAPFPAHTSTAIPSSRQNTQAGAEARNTISLSSQQTNELTPDQILQFMLFSRVCTFKAISQNLNISQHLHFKQLLSLLQKYCFLIHGNFVLKSQHVYNHDGSTQQPLNKQQQHIKTHTLRLSLARTYILHQFSIVTPPEQFNKYITSTTTNSRQLQSSPPAPPQSLLTWKPTISQLAVSNVLNIDVKELLPILKELSIKKTLPQGPMYNKDIPVFDDAIWEFKLPIDVYFLQTFPNIAASSQESLQAIVSTYFK
jgi:hypothetical protein